MKGVDVMKIERSKRVIENYVCPNCFHQVHECICKFYPPWQLIMIDVNIQEVVRILNQKGYTTIGCCESHFGGNNNIYIAFNMRYDDIGLPNGFTYAKGKTNISYSFKKSEQETKEKYEELKAEKLRALLDWAQSLPENPQIFRR